MNPASSWPPHVGQVLPRASAAYAAPEKLAWILSVEGHGCEWARVLHIGEHDAWRFWIAIANAVAQSPIYKIIDRGRDGLVCGVEVKLTIDGRTTNAVTSWHYEYALDAPRLVTAYPRH